MRFFLVIFIVLSVELFGANTSKVYIDGNRIFYVGEINKKGNNDLYKLFYSKKEKPKVIKLDSKSSDLNMAIELGEFIADNKLDTEVGDYCVGGCANYTFLAGKNKTISKYSVLAFYGGIYSSKYKEKIISIIKRKNTSILSSEIEEKYKSEIKILEHRIENIYSKSGVSFDFSKLILCDKFKNKILEPNVLAFYLDIEEMKSLKIKNLKFSPKGWYPEDNVDGAKIIKLTLNCSSSCDKDYCKNTKLCSENSNTIQDDSMDFSDVTVESNEIDENDEKLEENEIDKNIKKNKRKKIVKTANLSFEKKVEKKNLIKLLPLYLELSYLNTQLIDMKQNHTFFVELGLSLFSMKILNFNVNLGQVAIVTPYETGFMSYVFSPLNLSYALEHNKNKFLLELDIYKRHNLFKRLKWDKLNMTYFTKYLALKSSWFLFDRKESNMRLFFEMAIINGSHRDVNTSVSFSLGLAGEFYPIFLSF